MSFRRVALVGLLIVSSVCFAQQSAQKPPQDSKSVVVELKVTPVYPPAAQHLADDVIVKVAITEAGDVRNATAVSGDPIFSESALTAPQQWKFAPFYKGGKAVSISSQITFHFTEQAPTQPDAPPFATSTPAPIRTAIFNRGQALTHCPEVPKVKQSIAPKYPDLARRSLEQGMVSLRAIVDENGKVISAFPLEGPKDMIGPAAYAVMGWRYAPYVCEGQPTRLDMGVLVTFTMR